ncbi:MAG: glutathione S-transferase N-terminal domain-containing protein [Sphingorhabdus sp.]
MYRFYHAWTPNVIKVSIALEEMELPHERISVDISNGDQFKPEFLAISPNNKVPAIIDFAPTGRTEPFSLFETGAILIYLAEKTGSFLPSGYFDRSTVLQWLMWQMAGFGPMLGQAHHFIYSPAEAQPYSVRRYVAETARLYGVLDRRLEGRSFICDEYSIADMACWPWVIYRALHQQNLENYPNVERWFLRIQERPAVQRAIDGLVIPPLTPSADVQAVLRDLEEAVP